MSRTVQYVATLGDGNYASCEGLTSPVYLTQDEADHLGVVYGCGDAHPFTEDGVPECGIDLCHGRKVDVS